MKADVFKKYKVVFANYNKRNSSDMEVRFFFFIKKNHTILLNSYNAYLQIHYEFNGSVVLLLMTFVYCYSHCGSLKLFYVLLYITLCQF